MSQRVTNGNQTGTAPTVYTAFGGLGQAWLSLRPFVVGVDCNECRIALVGRDGVSTRSRMSRDWRDGCFPSIDAAIAWLLDGEE